MTPSVSFYQDNPLEARQANCDAMHCYKLTQPNEEVVAVVSFPGRHAISFMLTLEEGRESLDLIDLIDDYKLSYKLSPYKLEIVHAPAPDIFCIFKSSDPNLRTGTDLDTARFGAPLVF